MIINLTYVFFIIVAIYFAIDAYIHTRKRQVFPILFIFLFSFILEINWLMRGDHIVVGNDFLRTTRDILWTLGMVLFFRCMKNHFPYKQEIDNVKKIKKTKSSRKKK